MPLSPEQVTELTRKFYMNEVLRYDRLVLKEEDKIYLEGAAVTYVEFLRMDPPREEYLGLVKKLSEPTKKRLNIDL